MTSVQTVVMIAMAALGTMLTRYLPFLAFRSDKPTPKYLDYLGKVLPPAVFGMLVVYCLKGVSFGAVSGFMPEFLGIFSTVLIHLAFRKMLLSIVGGTAVYILLVNFIFI